MNENAQNEDPSELDVTEDDEDALFELIEQAIGEAVHAPDYASFRAWLTDILGSDTHELALDDPAEAKIVGCMLSRAVWNATPRIDAGFRPAPVPEPGRNDRCVIGLDCKMKDCCGARPKPPALGSDYVWSVLIDVLEVDAIADALEAKRIPKRVAPAAAHTLVDEDPRLARGVLEDLYAGSLDRCDPDDCEMLLALADAYVALAETAAERALFGRMTTADSRIVQADGWQGICRIEIDAGQLGLARDAFAKATRIEAENPSLGRLEVTLLCAEGRIDDARVSAQRWRDALREAEYADEFPDLVDFLEAACVDPQLAVAKTLPH